MNTNKTRLREKAIEESKRFAVLFIYLWALLMVFEIYRSLVLRAAGSDFGYRFRFALVKALILAKLLLIAERLHAPKPIREKALVYSILFKAVLCSAILVSLDILEEVTLGKSTASPSLRAFPQSLEMILGAFCC
jgi:hypothetical protein